MLLNLFSYSVVCLFIFFNCIFRWVEFLNFDKFQIFNYFSLTLISSCVLSKKYWAIFKSQWYSMISVSYVSYPCSLHAILPSFLSFSFALLSLIRASSTMLNNSEWEHPCLFLDLGRKVFPLSLSNIKLTVGLS